MRHAPIRPDAADWETYQNIDDAARQNCMFFSYTFFDRNTQRYCTKAATVDQSCHRDTN